MKREKFTFYGSWWGAVGHLSGELRGEVLTAIVEYGLYGETNSARGSVTKAILELVKPQIDRDRNLYENGCKGAEYGALGGRPKKPQENPKETPSEPQEKGNKTPEKPQGNPKETPVSSRARDISLSNISCLDINIQEQEKEESKEIEGAGGKRKTTARRFVKPAVEEVQSYCDERGNGIDARSFVDFYESKGWMVGKNPMRDWKAAVRTWEQRDEYRGNAPTSRQQKPTQAEIYAENERMLQETLKKIEERYGTE